MTIKFETNHSLLLPMLRGGSIACYLCHHSFPAIHSLRKVYAQLEKSLPNAPRAL